jgi:ABC-type transport system involved in multi-copper enzyme maturation permease subunit
MFTLIKREIQDNIVCFIAAAGLSAILIGISISLIYEDPPRTDIAVWGISIGGGAVFVIILGICSMGATQMGSDRTRKTSTFLAALAVSRNRILLARIITGILAILTLLVPLAITAVILSRRFAPSIPVYAGAVSEIFAATFLMGLACYCIGLLTCWTSSKITSALGAMGAIGATVLPFVLVPLVLVKGFGSHAIIILILFIGASFIRTWQKFMSTSL